MPKTKTHSATKKRFRTTASGKLVRRHAFKSHLLEHKTAKRKRGFRKVYDVSKADAREIRRLLGLR
ncbi:MAG TPA: 50S ribosomal protein L35 [Thermoleophilia bacterium]|mgnify:FL=1|nr:50S ribosomal protein L35 [Thermoleophilia bacterium]HQG03278.1 50S ribosomal protein L35 [Thermoleophilia bacterium]HQG55341.1 50S ribosomal protein L35 [Thermoleophilia bacterium]